MLGGVGCMCILSFFFSLFNVVKTFMSLYCIKLILEREVRSHFPIPTVFRFRGAFILSLFAA